MKRIIDFITLVLVVAGFLNWGLLGIFKMDFVAQVFGGQEAMISRIFYVLFFLAGIWSITLQAKEQLRSS